MKQLHEIKGSLKGRIIDRGYRAGTSIKMPRHRVVQVACLQEHRLNNVPGRAKLSYLRIKPEEWGLPLASGYKPIG